MLYVNEYEQSARLDKAISLSATLLYRGITDVSMLIHEDDFWTELANASFTKYPSVETRHLVQRLLVVHNMRPPADDDSPLRGLPQ